MVRDDSSFRVKRAEHSERKSYSFVSLFLMSLEWSRDEMLHIFAGLIFNVPF